MSKKSKQKKAPAGTIVENRKARRDFEVVEKLEAGLVLVGSEVKSLRDAKVHFADPYAAIERGEMWLYNVNIAEYAPANQFNHEPARKRKLLLSRREIERIEGLIRQQGMTVIPLRLYFKGPWVKVELGVAKGRKDIDKREYIKEKMAKREMERALKERR